MKKDIVYPVLLVIVSLVAGLAIGLALVKRPGNHRAYRPHFEGRGMERMNHHRPDNKALGRDMIFETIAGRLDLSDTQKEKLRGILDASREEAKFIIKGSQEKLAGLREKTNSQIRGLLTKEQQVEFDKIIAEHKNRMNGFRERFAPGFKRPGPGAGYPECRGPGMGPEEFPED